MGRRLPVLAGVLLSLLATTAVRAADPSIYQVGGTVTKDNFPGLATFIANSVDQFVGLKIAVPAVETGADSIMTEESDGMLSVFTKGSDVNLAFNSGYRKSGDTYFVEGFYRVKYGGLHQGISAYGITPARTMDVEATGKPVKILEIDRLKPGAQ